MSKKVIGALLALALVLSVFSFSVFAAGTGYDNDPSHTQTWGFANKTGSDGTYTVEVLLTTTYDVGPLQFQLEGVDKVTKVEPGSGYYPATAYANESGLISIIPDTSSTVAVKTLKKAVVAKVTYTSASNANVTIKNDVKSASKPQGTLMAAYADGNGYLNGSDFLVGQKAKIYAVGEEMPDVSTEAADLAVKAGVTGVYVDKTKTFGGAYAGVVYGNLLTDGGKSNIAAGTHYESYIEATNGGSLEITKSTIPARGTYWGTGTEVAVKNADGSVAAKYVIVLFGDVDGNSQINGADLSNVLKESKSTYFTDVQKLAGNCYIKLRVDVANGLYNIDANDVSAVLGQTKTNASFDFAAIADKHNTTATEHYK